jgi:hypothetical protein
MTVINLQSSEKKVFSQNGEDGVIVKIFELIGFSNRYYVEIGVEDGRECNTRYLREVYDCQGIQLDRDYSNPEINLYQELITAENINQIFIKYQVPKEFDLLSIDVDGNDFYLWLSLEEIYRPRVVVVEYNSSHSPGEDKVVPYSTQRCWDGTNYFGASILAWKNLAEKKGYSLVYADSQGINLFLIRNDVLIEKNLNFLNTNIVDLIHVSPNYYGCLPYGNLEKGHPPDPLQRKYLSSQEILATGQFKDITEESYQMVAQLNKGVSFAGYLADLLHPQLFRQGFYLPEEKFTWLKGDYAFLTIWLDCPVPLIIEWQILTVFLSLKNPMLKVEVWINRRLVDIWNFEYNRFQNNLRKFIYCSGNILNENSSLITIELKMEGSTSPKNLGISDDDRDLSLAISQIFFHPVDY